MDREIRGVLIDLDGVLYVGDTAIAGAREALEQLRARGIGCRFVTNTTTRTASEVGEKLARLGFDAAPSEVFSAVTATVDYLHAHDAVEKGVRLLVRDSVLSEFAAFPHDRDHPGFVVVGDIGAAWSYPLMNEAFRYLIDGAELIAMHRNKFFQAEDGLRLDIGAFVSGLEYVTGEKARIIGKPSPDFFRLGLDSLGLPAGQVAMVGDDIDSDVGGGQSAGLAGVLVKTGKYRPGHAAESPVEPDLVLDSFAALPDSLA